MNIEDDINKILNELYPICRSITGDGVRETFTKLNRIIPFDTVEYKTGQKCFDWEIPKEWRVIHAKLYDSKKNILIDFDEHNLHILNYSSSFEGEVSFEQLDQHLFYLENLPNAIPYRTSYYKEEWGFCLSYNDYKKLDRNEKYFVDIKTEHFDGSLTIGEKILKGRSSKEILISSYCCHPSMVNDNLSGPVTQAYLYNSMKDMALEYTYRFILVPETIGAIAYLANNKKEMENVVGGFVLTTCGGPGQFGVKQSFIGNHLVDDAVEVALKDYDIDYIKYPFFPDGSDERQFSSPGFRIPVTTISKDKYYEYDYYHTSLDNLDFVKTENLIKTIDLYKNVINVLETNAIYKSLNPNCEVQLGKRGLYPKVGGGQHQAGLGDSSNEDRFSKNKVDEVDAICWFLFLADGNESLISMSKKSKVPYSQLLNISKKLLDNKLIEKVMNE